MQVPLDRRLLISYISSLDGAKLSSNNETLQWPECHESVYTICEQQSTDYKIMNPNQQSIVLQPLSLDMGLQRLPALVADIAFSSRRSYTKLFRLFHNDNYTWKLLHSGTLATRNLEMDNDHDEAYPSFISHNIESLNSTMSFDGMETLLFQ